ncbi:MAG: GNAT family N-acetyltransferase [Imperialibacter sp.]
MDNTIEIVSFDEEFLKLSGTWLANPILLKALDIAPVDEIKQRIWFDSLNKRTDYQVYGVAFNGRKVGVCGLKNITTIDCEFFGYIGDSAFWRFGIGTFMVDKMIEEAIRRGSKKIYLHVVNSNTPALQLYKKLGFEISLKGIRLTRMEKPLTNNDW